MIKEDQQIFYKHLGSMVTQQRKAMGLTIAQLAKESGEQNKTIRAIEKGCGCSMHHLVWMNAILNISMDDVINNIVKESSNVEVSINDLI